jgi:hypothetical protein
MNIHGAGQQSEISSNREEMTMKSTFDLGIDSELRACDILSLRVHDVCHGDRMAGRAMMLQKNTPGPVSCNASCLGGRALPD